MKKTFGFILFFITVFFSCSSPFDVKKESFKTTGKNVLIEIEYPKASGKNSSSFNNITHEILTTRIKEFKEYISDYQAYGVRKLIGTYKVLEWSDSIYYVQQSFEIDMEGSDLIDLQYYFNDTKYHIIKGIKINQ